MQIDEIHDKNLSSPKEADTTSNHESMDGRILSSTPSVVDNKNKQLDEGSGVNSSLPPIVKESEISKLYDTSNIKEFSYPNRAQTIIILRAIKKHLLKEKKKLTRTAEELFFQHFREQLQINESFYNKAFYNMVLHRKILTYLLLYPFFGNQ